MIISPGRLSPSWTILNRCLVAFFDKHVMGIASPLLDGPDPNYPEVDFQSR
jgi:hypothetical protein